MRDFVCVWKVLSTNLYWLSSLPNMSSFSWWLSRYNPTEKRSKTCKKCCFNAFGCFKQNIEASLFIYSLSKFYIFTIFYLYSFFLFWMIKNPCLDVQYFKDFITAFSLFLYIFLFFLSQSVFFLFLPFFLLSLVSFFFLFFYKFRDFSIKFLLSHNSSITKRS